MDKQNNEYPTAKGENFLDYIRNYQLLKRDFSPCRWLVKRVRGTDSDYLRIYNSLIN